LMDGVMSVRAPSTRYAQSGDVNIAYQVLDEGDLDVRPIEIVWPR
jgi:hypothetical protein